MARVMRIAAAVLGGTLALLATGGDRSDAIEKPITVTVRPQIMLRRGDIRVEVRIPQDVDNRLLVIAWDSVGGSVGETRRQLDGEDAPVLHVLELRDQPAARYVFVTAIYGQRGELRGRATADIHVPDEGGS